MTEVEAATAAFLERPDNRLNRLRMAIGYATGRFLMDAEILKLANGVDPGIDWLSDAPRRMGC